MAKIYHRRPNPIEAIQWDGTFEGVAPIKEFTGKNYWCWFVNQNLITIRGTHGFININPTDWVYKDDEGFKVMTNDKFQSLYEEG